MTPTTRSPWILIVDDESGLRAAIARAFRVRGWRVLEAADGDEALQLLAQAPVAAVLTDIRMPKMDGVAMTRALRAQPALVDLPVFAYTGTAACLEPDRALFTGNFLETDGVRSDLRCDRGRAARRVGSKAKTVS